MTNQAKTRRVRLTVADRREDIMRAALRVVAKQGFLCTTFQDVADEARCTKPLVIQRLGKQEEFRRAVLDRAIADENLAVIGQGLILRDRRCRRLPDDVKKRALAAVGI